MSQEYECSVCKKRYLAHEAQFHAQCGVVVPIQEPEAVVELPSEPNKPSGEVIYPAEEQKPENSVVKDCLTTATEEKVEPAKVKGKPGRTLFKLIKTWLKGFV